jgi:uncharacterized protein (TIGR02145 family)
MKNTIKIILLVGGMAVFSLIMSCSHIGWVSDNYMIGKNSDGSGTDISLTGIVYEPYGMERAKHAWVVLRNFQYLADLPSLQKQSAIDSGFTRSTRTDGTGFYKIDSIRDGTYCIEGRDSNGSCFMRDSVKIAKNVDNSLLLDTLKPSATIQGIIPGHDDEMTAYIRVFGLDVVQKTDFNGVFSLDNLPEGNLRLQILVFGHDRQSCDTDTVMVAAKAGDTAYIYPATFDSRGGSTVAPQLLNCGDHAVQPLPPTNTACSFAGWFQEPACLNRWQFETKTVTRPITLYAKWIVTDIDGNVYTTVKIGNQVWLAENLRTTKFNDGSSIPLLLKGDSSGFISDTPGYCWYNNNEAEYKSTYGALYNLFAIKPGKLAPAGWHVSTDTNWDTLQNYLIAHGFNWDGTTLSNKIGKSLAAESIWNISLNQGAIGNDLTKNNSSRFSALPGGYRDNYGNFDLFGSSGFWWGSEGATGYADYHTLSYDLDYLYINEIRGDYCFSVRLLRD